MENIHNNKKKKKRIVSKVITIILLITFLILFGMLLYLNVIPILYTFIIFLLALVFIFFLVLFNFSKRKGFRLIGNFFSLIFIIISIIIMIYLYNTLGFLYKATNGHYMLKNYNVVVLSDSNYEDIKDLDNKKIGIYNVDDNIKDVQKKLNKKVSLQYQTFESREEALTNLLNNTLEAILLENSELSLIEENDQETFNKLKTIAQIEITIDISNIKNAIDINKEPFNLFITGIDTYGNINAVSRSDVNILVSVNPKKEKILITWIPRDYYLDINKSMKDKLTHAGMYGIENSIYAVSKLLDVKINYYVKVNFTSVVKVVDLLGGITVYNDETFTTNDNFTFREGNLTLNGEEALSFVRDRKHVTGGDLGRGKNQTKVIKALINEALSKKNLKNYNKLLNTLDGTFVTNMEQSNIFNFVKRELIKRRNWQIETNILTGTDGREYTYSISNQTVYVMLPDEESVNNAQNKIKEILS